MGRPKGSKNRPRAAAALAPLRRRRGPNQLREATPPYCTGQHCTHCGRPVVPAHALPHWYTAPPYQFASGNSSPFYTPPPIVSHGNGTTLDVSPQLGSLKHD